MKEFDAARKALGDGPGPAKRAMQRARLLRGVPPVPSRRVTRWALAGSAVLVAGVVFVLVRTGDRVQPGTQLTAGRSARVLRFAQGSVVTLGPGSSAHVNRLDAREVELVLASGRVDAEVTKGTGRTWRYHAGPWAVRVVGTTLHVQWEPARQALEVGVTEGAVEVSREGQPPVMVRAGELLRREPEAGARAPATPVVEVVPGAPVPVLVPPRSPEPEPEPGPRSQPVVEGPRAPSWRELLGSGRRREAIERAEADDVLGQLNLLGDDEALLLADAARLEQRVGAARKLLGLVLLRLGPDAAEAAFLLGRLDADAHAPDTARRYFTQAVALAPAGPFAEQSRGRLLEALLDLQDVAGAKQAARDYLANHANGAWANLAKKVETSR